MIDISAMHVGDYIRARVVNKQGDRNLDGVELKGRIVDVVLSHRMVRLESGWCVHAKDELLECRQKE